MSSPKQGIDEQQQQSSIEESKEEDLEQNNNDQLAQQLEQVVVNLSDPRGNAKGASSNLVRVRGRRMRRGKPKPKPWLVNRNQQADLKDRISVD
jgi:hypothetical protein